jgi:hypothetical protein
MAATKKSSGPRDLVKKPGRKAYTGRDEDGKFTEQDDQSKSLSKDVKQHAKTGSPRIKGTRATGPDKTISLALSPDSGSGGAHEGSP